MHRSDATWHVLGLPLRERHRLSTRRRTTPTGARTRGSMATSTRSFVAVILPCIVGIAIWWLLTSDLDPRILRSMQLLKTLERGGAKVFVKLAVRLSEASGTHGVFTEEAVAAGGVILTIPRSLLLYGNISALGREMRKPSTPHLAAYVETLPSACPLNLAARPEADLAAAAASPLYATFVELLAADHADLEASLDPAANETERTLLACLKQSRGMNDLAPVDADDDEFYPPVMVPFADLLNHAPGRLRTVRDEWDPSIGFRLRAARDLAAGEELVFPYRELASRTYLLLAFGFVAPGTPDAVLSFPFASRDAHAHDLRRRHGCAETPPSIPLRVRSADGGGGGVGSLGEPELRTGLFCARLLMYSASEAAWALRTGYMDVPLLEEAEAFRRMGGGSRGTPGLASGDQRMLYTACLHKDAVAVYALLHACATALEGETAEGAARLEALLAADGGGGVSADVAEAMRAESRALGGCVSVGAAVLAALEARSDGSLAALEALRRRSPLPGHWRLRDVSDAQGDATTA